MRPSIKNGFLADNLREKISMRSYQTLRIVLYSFLLTVIAVFSPAYPATGGSSPPINTEAHSFALHILSVGFDELKLGYQARRCWDLLKNIDLNSSSLVITTDDIESYNWANQTLLLTTKASDRFRIIQGTRNFDHKAFVVTINGERVYGGIFLNRYSAMAIKYPVIYVQSNFDEKIRLFIRPYQRIDTHLDRSQFRAIARQDVYNVFSSKGKILD